MIDAACAKNAGKHPLSDLVPNGLHGASTDTGTITQWWSLWPDAGLAGVTGPDSGLLVLDIDPDAGGWESIDAILLAAYGPKAADYDPETWSVETGSGGLHVHFRYPPGVDVRNSAGRLGAGLDVRASGGYVLLPPTLHRSKNRYRWADGYDPDSAPLADPPPWLLERVSQAIPRRQKAPPLADGEPIRDGSRNDTLTRKAGVMRRVGFPEEAILAALHVLNTARCVPPLGDAEVAKIAGSVARYAPAPEPARVLIRGRRAALKGSVRRGH